MALLNSRLELFDLHDVEAMVWTVIGSNTRLYLNPQQRESLATYLVEEIWRCSLRFDPDRGSFSTFAGTTARRRVVDWLRIEFGRTATSSTTAPTNSNGHNTSVSTMSSRIDWTQLSARGQAIARQIGTRLTEGYSATEIARELGTSSSWVSSAA